MIRSIVGMAVMLASVSSLPAAATETRDTIRRENALEGALDWQLTKVGLRNDVRARGIEGYCSRQSVKAGETLEIFVSTEPAAPFRLEIFRLGYYGGRGARLMKTLGPFDGVTQPDPEPGPKDLHECRWKASTSLVIPDDWLSGVYLGRLSVIPPDDTKAAWQSYCVFIVRDDRPADILLQCSDNTWNAYNAWPSHYSVYTNPKGTSGPWADVSFDRPYGRYAQHTSVVNDPLSIGSGEFLSFEYPLAYFLEQHGYDVSYVSNSDMLTPDRGLKCKAFISVGHDEYWDRRQFDSVMAMRDAGVSLLFLSGNSVCWVTPLRAGHDGRSSRIMFRGGPYGGDTPTALERARVNGPFPEKGPDEGYLMGARNVEPVNGGGDWTCTKPDHWIFSGTGMKAGDRIPGLIGWEYHGNPPADIPGLEVVGEGTALVGGEQPQQWAATIYPGPRGNVVFNASTIFWCQGLSDPPGHTLPWSHWTRPHGPDARVQRITHNVLARSLAPHGGEEVSVAASRRIHDAAPHAAFSDLVRWHDAWWCVFREADGHVGGDGKVRVLTSPDGETWESAAVVAEEGIDLRDPKVSVTPDDRLMLVAGGSVYRGGTRLLGRQPRVAFSKDGREWSPPQRVLAENDWLWRVTWHGETAYGVAYRTGAPEGTPEDTGEWTTTLYKSPDGVSWQPVTVWDIPGRPNETTLRFRDDGTCLALVRRESGDRQGWFGSAAPPYRDWTWRPIGRPIGGPELLVLKDGRILAAGRDDRADGPVTAVDFLDPGSGNWPAGVALPSGGDTSYPGMVELGGEVWMSYYTSHEGKSAISFARLAVPPPGGP